MAPSRRRIEREKGKNGMRDPRRRPEENASVTDGSIGTVGHSAGQQACLTE
jgi:hypothetical protein